MLLYHMNKPRLDRTQIDIWQFSLAREPEHAFEQLNDEEKIRARRYHFERHQRRFIVARAMLRAILAAYLNEPARQLQFDFNRQGKPFLAHPSNIQFNLSHSGEWALLAVGREHPMGIDLEFFSARPYVDLGAQLFSDREMQGLRALPSRLQALGFFHVWAQKEAFIKASGLGLSYPTREFSVSSLPGEVETVEDRLHQRSWQIRAFMPMVSCCAALCHDAAVTTINRQQTDPCDWLGDRRL
ncbi:4'-phosphopantetheinyl transferase family protein [Legionella sp. CNM-4043-24]|uniref:4'-phosphopantetheinyl transferase family protein n=1 Tax=Legionella sp. CNM-4043-24 TaxID=3421646 RepID=UPI00403ABC7E